jgi:pimeloyl-ACP methyl ester carboxylesterase
VAAPDAIRPVVPMQWQVNNLTLAGLSWGERGERPLLALHGWLDNAASFSCLAPLLTGYHVVALDLTGHGQSGRRSADASYQIWDDLPEILGVLDALGWDTFDLMGHSRGAIIATLLASAFPERVRGLILLDAVSPEAVAEERFPTQLRTALEDKRRLLNRASRVFPSIEEAVESRAGNSLPALAAKVLAERNLRACAEGVTWTTDPRLRGASAVKLTAGHIRAVLQGLTMPVLLMLAARTSPELSVHAKRWREEVFSYVRCMVLQEIPGGHHFHMESCVDSVAQHIEEFLSAIEQRLHA